MSFRQALSSFWSNYTNFKGRTPRSGYWWVALFLILISLVLFVVDLQAFSAIWPADLLAQGLGPLSILFILVVFLPNFTLTVRRLHDTGRSGWWLLFPLLPTAVLGLTIPREIPADGLTTFGDLGLVSQILSIAGTVGLVVVFIFYLQKSQPGENKYGPNPLGN